MIAVGRSELAIVWIDTPFPSPTSIHALAPARVPVGLGPLWRGMTCAHDNHTAA
jgi:hypothetical protein